MKHLIVTLLAFLAFSSLHAGSLRLLDSVPCQYLGRLYYGENVGYQLNFITDDPGHRLLTVTLVVPRKGNRSASLPLGEFRLGTPDSVKVNALDYYGCSLGNLPFQECRINIVRQKKGNYGIDINYMLKNGERGEYSYSGKIKNRKRDARAKFKFMPEQPLIKNWQITEVKLEVLKHTAFSSREVLVTFACAEELYGTAVIYLPIDSINGRYVIRYGKTTGSCERSSGGFDGYGYYNIFNTGMEEESDGFFYYPVSGFMEFTEGKMFFEFTSLDGSVVRGCYKGQVSLSK